MNRSPTQTTPHSHSQRWLLAHDIRDPRRLQRVWRYLRQEGVRLQYSVYVLAGTRHHIETVLAQLRTLIDEQADDVRVYPLNENTCIWGLGTQFDTDGNTLCDAFIDKMIQLDENTYGAKNPAHKLNF